jgi:hypothetical protein
MSRDDDGEERRERRYTPAQTLGYAARDVAKTQANAAMTEAAIDAAARMGEKAVDFLIALLQAGTSNPLLGAAGAVITANILKRAKVIEPNAEALVDGMALGLFGVSLATTGAEAAADVIAAIDPADMFSKPAVPTNPMAPTAQVVMISNGGSERFNERATTRALAGQLVPETHYLAGGNE